MIAHELHVRGWVATPEEFQGEQSRDKAAMDSSLGAMHVGN